MINVKVDEVYLRLFGKNEKTLYYTALDISK